MKNLIQFFVTHGFELFTLGIAIIAELLIAIFIH